MTQDFTTNLKRLSRLEDLEVVAWAAYAQRFVSLNETQFNCVFGYRLAFYACNAQEAARSVRSHQYHPISQYDAELLRLMASIEEDIAPAITFMWKAFKSDRSSLKWVALDEDHEKAN